MVATRSHASSTTPSTPLSTSKSYTNKTPTSSLSRVMSRPTSSSSSTHRTYTIQLNPSHPQKWSHTPSNLALIWLSISLPLVIWDTGYVLLRPLSMPGGSLHWPIWVPYELYGTVDHVYGWKAFNNKEGFTGAQGFLNAVETAIYLYYLWIVYAYGVQRKGEGRGAPSPATAGWLGMRRQLGGKKAAEAVVVALVASTMTFSKTVLYWLIEYCSDFANIGHNSLLDLVMLWIIPNVAWIIVPGYLMYVMGSEITEGLAIAAGESVASLKTD